LYENGISLNVVNFGNWEILLESIEQYGPRYRSPSYHEVRGPLLDRAVNRTTELRKKQEDAWNEYGCILMFDGWTDTNHCHLINFLFFIEHAGELCIFILKGYPILKGKGDKPKGFYKAEILPKEQKGKEKQHKKTEQDQGSRCLRTQPHSKT
jgi:hypothetical protein